MKELSVYPIRYYALGHSFLRHKPFQGWTWLDPENGARGMAASTINKDYFARFQYYLKENFHCTMEAVAENISEYERLCVDGMTKKQYVEHELYDSVREHLAEFRPNLVTVFVGANNVAKDYHNVSLFFDTLFELIRTTVGEKALVIAANHSPKTTDVGKACEEYAQKYGFAYCDVSFIGQHPSRRENPYYAFMQYPEYDAYIEQYAKENGGAKPVEFRSHPSDFGMDAIGKALYETAAPLLPSCIETERMSEQEWKERLQKTSEPKKAVRTESVPSFAEICTAERFDFDRDCEGVLFNGFNVYVKNSFLSGNSAPGTGFSIAHNHLSLNKTYQTFSVRMNVHAEASAGDTAFLHLTVNTEGGTHHYKEELKPNVLTEYRFDISDIRDVITGFTIAPSVIECNADVDWIAFC